MLYNPAYQVIIASKQEGPGQTPVFVTAPMPEQFMYDVASLYEAPFTQGLTGHALVDTMLKVGFAARLVTHSLTAQIWQGSTETELGLELEFHAETDPITEVRDPILQLMKLATPSTDFGGIITSPGPKLEEDILMDLAGSYKSQQAKIPDTAKGQVSTGELMDGNNTAYQGSGSPAATNPETSSSIGTTDYFKSRIKDQITVQIGKYAYFDSVVITNVQKTYESQFDYRTGLPFFARVSVRFKPLFMVTRADLDKIFGNGDSSPVATAPPIEIGSGALNSSVPVSGVPLKPSDLRNQGTTDWNAPYSSNPPASAVSFPVEV